MEASVVFIPLLSTLFFCTGGEAGISCDGETPSFTKVLNGRLKLNDLGNAIELDASLDACRAACISFAGWPCLSFVYSALTQRCGLYKVTQQTNHLLVFPHFDYYEAHCSKPGVNLVWSGGAPNSTKSGIIVGASVGVIAIVIIAIVIITIIICKKRKKYRCSTNTSATMNDKVLSDGNTSDDNNATNHITGAEAHNSDDSAEDIHINPTYQGSSEDDTHSSSASHGESLGPPTPHGSQTTSPLKSPDNSTPGEEPAESYVALEEIQQRKRIHEVQLPPADDHTDRSVASHRVDDSLRDGLFSTDEMGSQTINNELYGT